MISAIVSLGLIGLGFGLMLALAARKFAVPIDPDLEKVIHALPGSNCGACGCVGCEGLAKEIIQRTREINSCPVGGKESADEIADILKLEKKEVKEKLVAKVFCKGTRKEAKNKFIYYGLATCQAEMTHAGGSKACIYGCLGWGDCLKVCPFEAITVSIQGIPQIDETKCTGCGKCVQSCSRKVIQLTPQEKKYHILCKSQDKAPQVKKICKVGCLGCRVCFKICAVKAIFFEDNLAKIDYSKCNQCGLCLDKCPSKTIVMAQ